MKRNFLIAVTSRRSGQEVCTKEVVLDAVSPSDPSTILMELAKSRLINNSGGLYSITSHKFDVVEVTT